MSLIEKTRNWYGRYERPVSSLSLLGGFVFNILTLKRVDMLWENIWIFGHIILVGVFIVLIHVIENKDNDEKNPSKAHFWFVNILQYFFGGTLSTFLVFYFRSTDIYSTWPFFLILVLAFIANESFKRHYIRLSFQITLFFISIYSFFIFLIPIILHKIGPEVFIISGVASLVFIFVYTRILMYFAKHKLKEEKRIIPISILSIFVLFNFLYFTNLIPPIPLSVKDSGVYHSIYKNKDSNYEVAYENNGWKSYFKLYKDYKKIEGSPTYFYSAIFSPNNLNLTIIHEWQYLDKNSKKWVTDNTIKLNVLGGRDEGFRTYSMRSNLTPGKWRVKIKTMNGQTIGSSWFNIVAVDTEPILITEIKK
jgi:mRNA-degrading endonuclease RelE of RelBE toxin-antitoxin system